MEQITFRDLGLREDILRALDEKGYGYPTKVQEEAIPHLMQWKDMMAKAPTGTGKTFAFGIPMIEHIDETSEDLQGLILAPTRELAMQICDEMRGLLAFRKGVRVAVVYGGQAIEKQVKSLQKKPQIVVATPGRLMDHYNRKNLRLDKIHSVVLDEADRMLDMGFFKDVTKILDRIKILQPVTVAGETHPKKHLGLFSATISEEVMTVSWMYQRDEVEITVKAEAEERPDIDQFSIQVPQLEKTEVTLRLIRTCGWERVIVFCNTKHMCQRLCDDLKRAGLDADCLHGDIRQATREKTMKTFRDGKLPVLIATDVASRGIDVEDVDCVINFDVPEENEYYIHRIGRTGRARKKGVAWSVIGSFPEKAKLDEIAKYAHFTVQPMEFDENGALRAAEIRTPPAPPKRRRF
ncbi:MAG: DEAD/DEAH box helicase [Oscillospiraceae bacterium]|nr:DEAD/DEAH box helicase [Oscillospiraceae bacterium]